jgi:hypothetical protein
VNGIPFGWSWSISTEWFFYVVYLLGLFRIGSVRSILALVAMFSTVALIAYRLTYLGLARVPAVETLGLSFFTWAHPSSPENGVWPWVTYYSPYFHIWEFVGGVIVCQIYLILRDRPVPQWVDATLFWSGLTWILTAWLIYADLAAGPSGSSFYRFAPEFLTYVGFLHRTFLMAPGLLALILACALGRCGGARALSSGLLVFGGEISYSLYLGHPLAGRLAPTLPDSALSLAFAATSAIALAAGLYTIIEVPARRRLRSFFRRVPIRPAADEPTRLAAG